MQYSHAYPVRYMIFRNECAAATVSAMMNESQQSSAKQLSRKFAILVHLRGNISLQTGERGKQTSEQGTS